MLTEEITPAQLAQIAALLMQTGIGQKGAIDRAYRLFLDCQQFLEEHNATSTTQRGSSGTVS